MNNADKIRNFTDEQLKHFLWVWQINTLTLFCESGGKKQMDVKQLSEWLSADESTFVCPQTEVDQDFIFNQDFNLKKNDN